MDIKEEILTAEAPQMISRDEVREYLQRRDRRRAVNPRAENARIMKR